MTEATVNQTRVPVVEVSRSQLPVSCPRTGTDPAALHPRVYIPLKQVGVEVSCPYCGTKYVLTG